MLQLITDIQLTVPLTFLNDHNLPRNIRVLRKEKSFYVLTGPFDDLEKFLEKKHPECQPVVVSSTVLDYMEKKCTEKLNRIVGQDVLFKHNSNDTTQVTFKHPASPVSSLQPICMRHRFITFYQRTASDLKVITLDLSPRNVSELEQHYPLLLFKGTNPVTVIGHYIHVAKLEESLRQSPSSRRDRSSNSLPRQGEEICPICMEPMAPKDTKKLQCKHSFCKDCVEQAFSYKPVCPVCGELYGVLKGTQPEGGQMNCTIDPTSLPGYERYKTIVINYYIPDGIQKVRALVLHCHSPRVPRE